MFYNLLNFPTQEPANRIQHLDFILNDYQPDLFMVCELNSQDGANSILATMQDINPNYSMANFVLNSSDDGIGNQNDLQNLIFYDSSKFVLESQDQITSIFRDFNRYSLKLNTLEQSTNPLVLEVFVCHLKATDEDENLRLQMVNDLQSYLNNPSNNFDSDSYVILAGDLNLYSSSEPAFQELLDNSNIVTFVDPINRMGSWHTNINYLDVFTQSTRTTTSLGGASGGFDDRFDFIMTSDNMLTDSQLYYVNGSYKTYGNNNNPSCFNREINSINCSGTEYSLSQRNALYNFSDHLPVTLALQTNQTLGIVPIEHQNSMLLINGNLIENELSIKVNFELISSNYIIIYNTLGQKVRTIAIDQSSIIREDLSTLSSGLYYLMFENDQSLKPIKFIKVN
ncbi:MAG: T9SS type A sorting domain-containing protein [Flavobacteriaceae bacterium]|nr:T9SS type A sorting domain-containing protein [Flavobacteriaceae bacterium]